ncbi:hypothetical protein ACN68I_07305 [Aerococcus viridans]|uniref:hypothetical protein n=1 Tax=Aerococcus viridans TaxID=1377 RepID=UPI003B21B595
MTTILFKKSDHNLRIRSKIKIIEFDKKYNLYDGIQAIYKTQNNALNKDIVFTITPTFFDKKEGEDIEVFADEIPIGLDHSLKIFEYLKTHILKTFHNEESEEKDHLLEFIEKMHIEYDWAEQQVFYENNIESSEKKTSEPEVPSEDEAEETPGEVVPEETPNEPEVPGEVESLNEEQIKRKNKKQKISISPNKKNTAIFVSILLVLGLGFVANQYYQAKQIPLETHLENNNYESALKYYPDNIDEIERDMFLGGYENIDQLEDLNANYDYPQTEFDLAFLNKEYDKVVELKDLADTDGRKAQLVIAYLDQNLVDEAYELNTNLKSNELDDLIIEEYIELAKQALANDDVQYAKDIASKIDNDELNQDIKDFEDKQNNINSTEEKLEKESDSNKKKDIQKDLDNKKEDMNNFKSQLS